jgi:hypothetical protein
VRISSLAAVPVIKMIELDRVVTAVLLFYLKDSVNFSHPSCTSFLLPVKYLHNSFFEKHFCVTVKMGGGCLPAQFPLRSVLQGQTSACSHRNVGASK